MSKMHHHFPFPRKLPESVTTTRMNPNILNAVTAKHAICRESILRAALRYNPKLFRTPSLTLRSYSGRRSRHILAASTLAGLSSLGSASMLMTLMRIFSTDWMGDHRSEACS